MKKPRGRIPEAARLMVPQRSIPAPMAMIPIPLVPKRVAAQYLGIAESTLNHWIADGTAPPAVQYIKNGPVYFRIAVLDAFIEAHEQPQSQVTHRPPALAGEDDSVADTQH